MNGSTEAAGIHQAVSPLEAFTGTIARANTGPVYSAGLAVVAFAMVLLPTLYLALIALTAWGVFWHLIHDTWIFSGGSGRGGFIRLILYLGPAVAGGILVFFMVKPFFAKRVKGPDPVTLDPAKEPLLFAFVRKICGLVGAPAPCRIDVDCQVNASASLRRGLWSRDLVLTIGLPLAAGLNMRQFAGVLAHEFGHFAQGAGMRLTYVIRRINFWFARVVYERDQWDVQLEQAASNSDWRIMIVLQAARGCVWLTRRILWVLMHAGNAISCFMLRQMEFDADSYEAKVAGSDTFELTAVRLRVLNVATQSAYEDVQQCWASKRLPADLPLLIGHKAGALPAEVCQKLTSAAAAEKTGWFDTHPCDSDRVRAATSLGESGVFRVTKPAMQLFSDFAELSKAVTRHQYEKHMELEFADENLMSAEEILRESAASSQADAAVMKYYGAVNVSLKPLLISGELPCARAADALTKWRKACERVEQLRPEVDKLAGECGEQHRRLADAMTAHCLTRAAFKLEPGAFGLPTHAMSLGEQENAARAAVDEARGAIRERLAGLEPFMHALRERVTLALQLGQDATVKEQPEDALELGELVRLLAAVTAEMPHAHEMGSKLKAFVLLAQNRGHHSNPEQVDRIVAELAAGFTLTVRGIQERLKDLAYPFSHARGKLTVAEYAKAEKPHDHEWLHAYQDANAHMERLFALHYRLVGQLLIRVEETEKQIGAMPHVERMGV